MDKENIKKLLQELGGAELTEDYLKAPAIDFLVNLMKWIDIKFDKIEDLEKLITLVKVGFFQTDPPIYDPDLYKEFEQEFVNAANKNLKEFNKIKLHYFKKIGNKFTLDRLFPPLLLHTDVKFESEIFLKNLTFPDFQKKIIELFVQLNITKNEDQFLTYFFNLTLNFGYLIEGYSKEMLCIKLMIKNLLEDEDNTSLFCKTPMIGNILNSLGQDREIRKIRNSIFHSDFLLKYKVNWDERTINFKNGSEDFELSLKEFNTRFFKIIQIFLTFNVALMYVHFCKIPSGNEEVLEFIKQVFKNSYLYLFLFRVNISTKFLHLLYIPRVV